MELNGKQKKILKSAAHHLKPIGQVGKNGVNEALLKQLLETLESRELIKVSVLQACPLSAKEVAKEIEAKSDISVVQVIGHTLIIFKEASEEANRQYSKQL